MTGSHDATLEANAKADLPQALLEVGRGCNAREVSVVECTTESPESLNLHTEVRFLAVTGLPLAFSQAAKIIQDMSTAIMLGHFSTLVLAATSVSAIWTSLTDVMFFMGLDQLSTLCSQAYGAGNKALVGYWLQIFLVFATIGAIPVFALRWCTTPMLEFLGIDHDVAEVAGKFAVWNQGSFLFDMWYFSAKQYYASQLIVYPDAVVDAVFIFVNIALVALFVYVLDIGEDGIVGAALATTLTRCLRTGVYLLYCWGRGYHKETWRGWSCKEIAVRDRWRTLLILVIPAAVGGIAEELQFQVCAVLAGRMGPVKSASLSLSLNVIMFFFLFAMAMGEATGIRMARFLGEGRVAAARYVSNVGIGVCVVGGAVVSIILALLMKPFARLASRDEDVQQTLFDLRWVCATIIALLSGFMPLVSVLTKQGRAWINGTVIPLMCWCVGFPVTFVLNNRYGLVGIYDGLTIGYGLATLSLFIAYRLSNWPELVRQARERAEVNEEATQAEEQQPQVQQQQQNPP